MTSRTRHHQTNLALSNFVSLLSHPGTPAATSEPVRDPACLEALEKLGAQLRGDVHDVAVSMASGIITLSGTVPTKAAMIRAEEICAGIAGVQYVRNELRMDVRGED